MLIHSTTGFLRANLSLYNLEPTDMDITYLRHKTAGAYRIYENPGVIIKKISLYIQLIG
jgi:hypothetical protein